MRTCRQLILLHYVHFCAFLFNIFEHSASNPITLKVIANGSEYSNKIVYSNLTKMHRPQLRSVASLFYDTKGLQSSPTQKVRFKKKCKSDTVNWIWSNKSIA